MSERSPRDLSMDAIYRDNVEKLYKFFYFKVLNKQIAEDMTSDTFIALAEKFNTLENDKDTIEKYLYGIARNVWNGYLRKKYKEPILLSDNMDDFSSYVEKENDLIQSMSLKERALRFINMLPKMQKIVAMMRLIEGLAPKEIAVELDKSINYVKVTLRRALRRLEQLIAQADTQNEGTDE